MKRKLLLFVLMFAMMFSMMGCEPSDSNERDDSEQVEESKDDKEDNKKESEKVTRETLVITAPEGFAKTEVSGIIYYTKENVSSNIVINTTKNDGSLASVSGQKLIESIEPALEQTAGEDVTLSLISEKKIVVDGHEGFTYSYSYTCWGVDIIQTQYAFENGDVYEFITFTDFVVEGYASAFEDCAKKISYE